MQDQGVRDEERAREIDREKDRTEQRETERGEWGLRGLVEQVAMIHMCPRFAPSATLSP